MKSTTVFGLISGSLAGIWLISEHFLELKNPGVASFAGIVGYLIYFSFLFISIWYYREKVNAGLIDFKTAIRTGVLTAVFYSLALGCFTFINYKYVNTDFFIQQKPTATQEEIELSKSFGRILQGVILFIPTSILSGALLSALLALLMRREK